MRTRPVSLTIVAWLFLVVGFWGLVHAGQRLLQDASASSFGRHEVVDVSLAAASGVLAGLGGGFLLGGRNWARWAIVVWMAFHLVISAMHSTEMLLVHTAIFAPIFFFLFRRPASVYLTRT